MVRLRTALIGSLLVGACRAQPSAIPLADVGQGRAFEDGALSRNRVAKADRESEVGDFDSSDIDADETIAIVASDAGVAADAGVSEAGVASSDAGDVRSRWAGEYFGKDRQVTRVPGNPEDVALDDKAHTRVEEPTPGVAVVSLVSSDSGEVICALKHRVTGDRAKLAPGEFCPPLRLLPPLSVEGSAKLDGDTLVVELEGHGSSPAGDIDVEYYFEGKRR